MKQNIILLGFMGSGKTTVGKLLAPVLNLRFIDLDSQIEKNSGLTIKRIFQEFGEQYFRELENKEIEHLKNESGFVLSLGGGAFCNDKNIEILKKAGLTVYLKTDYLNLLARYNSEETAKRPLLQEPAKVKDLLESREKFYSQADLIIGTDDQQPEEIMNTILSYLKI